jgi:lysyl-tRNA synthetase class II
MTDYSSLEKIRLEKIEQLKTEGIDPYPLRNQRTHTSLKPSKHWMLQKKLQNLGHNQLKSKPPWWEGSVQPARWEN